jgi:hypothetical protein
MNRIRVNGDSFIFCHFIPENPVIGREIADRYSNVHWHYKYVFFYNM